MPEDITWVKLYRKLRNHPIMTDSTAINIFIWILICVKYETGEMITGRNWASEELGMNPNTFYKGLKRLEKKYDLVTLSSNNRFTTVTVKKWAKYQATGNSDGNNKVTTKEQQSNTKQELRIKNKDKESTKFEKVMNLLTEKNIAEYMKKYGVGSPFVKEVWEKMVRSRLSRNLPYKNWHLAFHNWIKPELEKKNPNRDSGYTEEDLKRMVYGN